MNLKRERPETGDFGRRKQSVCEGKILQRNFNITRNNLFLPKYEHSWGGPPPNYFYLISQYETL